MKATGIVRRIDDLGRVVIPKEIRRNLSIREGAPLEIYIDEEGGLILKKYSPIKELGSLSQDYVESLYKKTQLPAFVIDHDGIVAMSGVRPEEWRRRATPEAAARCMDERRTVVLEGEDAIWSFSSCVIAPIVAEGDSIGAVVLGSAPEREVGELEVKLAETAAGFLARQVEA